MLNALLDHPATDQAAQARRHAYNAAFEELGLSWRWDVATYDRVLADGRDGVRIYLETQQSHLLRAYEADFLVEAIEAVRARYHAGMARSRTDPAPCASGPGDSLTPAGGRSTQSGAPAHRSTPPSLQA